jgi:hypothetical protein
MIIIADGGSTKTSWCLLTDTQQKIYFNTEGYNPYFSSTEYIIDSLRNNLPADLAIAEISEVYYYGAGCSTDEKVGIVVKAMQTVFTAANFANATALADAIVNERRIELLGEGVRGTDITRLGLPLPAKPGVAEIKADAQQYIWPISSTELLLNPLCKDN